MSRSKLIVMFLAFVGVLAGALIIGPTVIDPFRMSDMDREILMSVRLPRVMVAALMGIALGASGAVLQGILRNPLADPYILGISSGASLFAAFGLMLGIYSLGKFTVPVAAFAGACLVSVFVGAFGWKRGVLLPDRVLLAGIGLGFLCSAVLMLLMSVSSDQGLRRAVLWMFGDLSMADWSLLPSGAVFIAGGFFLAVSRAKGLNALILGDEFAYSLGFAVNRERMFLFLSIALMTASSVALGGTIGFIGLLMPHIMRFLVGADSKVLIPASAFAGGAFLCIADLVGRMIMPPVEIPSGVVTAILGAPYFLYLLRRKDVLSL